MASCVFLRGANVGGSRVFRPAALARELAEHDVVNVGAAGTFAVRGRIGQKALREAIAARLPFETEIMICSERALRALTAAEPYPRGLDSKTHQRLVSVLARAPRGAAPRLPLDRPSAGSPEFRIHRVEGKFCLGVRKLGGRPGLDVNELVERALGVRTTTRTWNTICKLAACFSGD